MYAQLNSDLGNLIPDSLAIANCNANFKLRGTTFARWNPDTLNTPYKAGMSPAAEGVMIDVGIPSYRTQISIGYSAETLFMRRYVVGADWSEWRKVAYHDDLGTIPSGVFDLDAPPKYHIFEARAGSTGLPENFGNAWYVLQLMPDNNTFGAQIAFGFGVDKIAMRRKSNSPNWTSWKYFSAL